ncbi:DNRLRE domain-containing protein [Fibrobacterota bacterium]
MRVLIKFDNIEKIIPDSINIAYATLSIFTFDEYITPGSMNPTVLGGIKEVYRITKGWDASSVTWHDPWDNDGCDFDEEIIASNTNDQKQVWEDFDVSELIEYYIDNPDSNYGFLVTFPDDPTIDFGGVAYSSEYSDISKRPKLTVYY